jgi:predicted aminopeptidase
MAGLITAPPRFNSFFQVDMSRLRLLLIAAAVPLIAGCSTFSYYMQSIDGELKLLRARQPIADVIADAATPPALKARLERATEIREFASRELRLPDNPSYRSYADLKRPFVVWNIFAAAEFSIEPEKWCFLFVGCVGYRGYFARDNAEAFARELRGDGLDVFVGGVPAFSTLGWFDDPVLNTFVGYPEYRLARLIFHELAHQVAYVKGDSEFNESFAVAVETEGVQRWIARNGNDAMRADFLRFQQRRAQFSKLMLKYRRELGALYATQLAPAAMRERKSGIFAALVQDYQRLKAEWGGFAGYDRFFDGINNAHLASIAIYNELVPQFQQMIARHNGDLGAFYAEVKQLAKLGKDKRALQLGIVAQVR